MRATKEYVRECRDAVTNSGHRLSRPRTIGDFAGEVEHAVDTMLSAEVHRLSHASFRAPALPAALLADVETWRTQNGGREGLERAVRLRTARWRRATRELLQRLALDWPELVHAFALQSDAALVAISEPLGDFHCGGRAVFKVQFDDGSAVIYKPRTVGAERTFARVVDWFDRSGFSLALRRPTVLARSGYGWTGFVAATPCHTLDEVELYCERQGAFLAIFFLLCGSDCIHDNVIGDGAHPIWIDTECMCGLSIPQRNLYALPTWIRESVLGTSLIFHGNDRGEPPRARAGLKVSTTLPYAAIYHDGEILHSRYREAVIRGFTAAYEWVLAHRDAWLGSAGVLAWWGEERVRLLPRGTAFYSILADILLLAPGESRKRVQAQIAELLRHSTAAAWPDEMIDLELRALLRGDVPYWSFVASGRDLRESLAGRVPSVADASGLERTTGRLLGMSSANLKDQVWLIDTHLQLPNIPAS